MERIEIERGYWVELQPGEVCGMLYTECPRCGFNLASGEYPVETICNQQRAEHIEQQAKRSRFSAVSGYCKWIGDALLKRVVNPFAQPDEKTAQRDQ